MNWDYQELLQKNEWKAKRKLILRRDHYICKDCHKGATIRFSFDDRVIVIARINGSKSFSSNDIVDESGSTLYAFKKLHKIDGGFIEHHLEGFPFYIFTHHSGLVFISSVPWNRSLKNCEVKDFAVCRISRYYNSLFFLYRKKEDPYEFIDTHYYPLLDFTKLYSPRAAEIREIEYCFHVHHKYYIIGNMPWDYNNKALVTLCNKCHADRHQLENIPVWGLDCGGRKIQPDFNRCDRCDGDGYIEIWRHIAKGVCFKCGGTGYIDRRSLIPFQGFSYFIHQFDFSSTDKAERLTSDYKKTVISIKVISTDLGRGEGEMLFALISCEDGNNVIVRIDPKCKLEKGDIIDKNSVRVYLRDSPHDPEYHVLTLTGKVVV